MMTRIVQEHHWTSSRSERENLRRRDDGPRPPCSMCRRFLFTSERAFMVRQKKKPIKKFVGDNIFSTLRHSFPPSSLLTVNLMYFMQHHFSLSLPLSVQSRLSMFSLPVVNYDC